MAAPLCPASSGFAEGRAIPIVDLRWPCSGVACRADLAIPPRSRHRYRSGRHPLAAISSIRLALRGCGTRLDQPVGRCAAQIRGTREQHLGSAHDRRSVRSGLPAQLGVNLGVALPARSEHSSDLESRRALDSGRCSIPRPPTSNSFSRASMSDRRTKRMLSR